MLMSFGTNLSIKKGARIMVCTSAFGTSVEFERVKGVFHFGGSSSLAEFAQEIGRGGRVEGTTNCVLIYCVALAERFNEMMVLQLNSSSNRLE